MLTQKKSALQENKDQRRWIKQTSGSAEEEKEGDLSGWWDQSRLLKSKMQGAAYTDVKWSFVVAGLPPLVSSPR